MYMLEITGFPPKWINWIKTCIASSSISILVNGYSTLEFVVEKGLKQGDPLAPFLFLVIAKGSAGLFRSVVEKGVYQSLSVLEEVEFSII